MKSMYDYTVVDASANMVVKLTNASSLGVYAFLSSKDVVDPAHDSARLMLIVTSNPSTHEYISRPVF